jgi:hypothetical protein
LRRHTRPRNNLVISARVVQVLQIDGLLFKDLNKNGKLDVYEDWRQPIEERVKDLVAQMTLEEKSRIDGRAFPACWAERRRE